MLFEKIVVPAKDAGIHLTALLQAMYPWQFSFNQVQQLLRKKLIRIQGQKVTANYRVHAGEMIEIAAFLMQTAEIKRATREKYRQRQQVSISTAKLAEFKSWIIYQDKNIIALNKPYGLPVQGGSKIRLSVADFLPYLQFDTEETPKLVHRLDRHTSGILVLARNRQALEELMYRFRERQKVTKKYAALVLGIPKPDYGIINCNIKKGVLDNNKKRMVVDVEGSEAITKYQVQERFTNIHTLTNTDGHRTVSLSLLDLEIMTGKMHQIRIHLRHLGNPIISDGKYGGRDVFITGLSDKMHLVAYKLALPNFFGKNINLQIDLPDFFTNSLKFLTKHSQTPRS